MKLSGFVCLILILTAVLMQVYSGTRQIYNGVGDYKAEIEHLKDQSEKARLKLAVERELSLEFRQNVAALMPDVLKTKGQGLKGYPYRNLASVVARHEAENVRMAIAKTIFERARLYFRQKNYAKSEHLFQQIIDKYGYTQYVAESYFLLAESYYQTDNLEDSARTIQQMVDLFPQDELTGSALIRLGHIYEKQNRIEDAIDIYKTVLRSYPQRSVASQARASLRGMDR